MRLVYPENLLQNLMTEHNLKVVVVDASKEFLSHPQSKFLIKYDDMKHYKVTEKPAEDKNFDQDDNATIMYTSGTTSGVPKGKNINYLIFIIKKKIIYFF